MDSMVKPWKQQEETNTSEKPTHFCVFGRAALEIARIGTGSLVRFSTYKEGYLLRIQVYFVNKYVSASLLTSQRDQKRKGNKIQVVAQHCVALVM